MRIFDRYIPQFVYGSFDGIVTTYAVIAAAAAAGLSSTIVVIFGLANLFADGFSMGASAFLSHQAEKKRPRKLNRENTPIRLATVTFLSFVVVGFMPVLPYFVDIFMNLKLGGQQMFIISSALTCLMFIWIGYAKSVRQKRSIWSSMFETFSLGVIAASLAYFVGAVLKDIFGS